MAARMWARCLKAAQARSLPSRPVQCRRGAGAGAGAARALRRPPGMYALHSASMAVLSLVPRHPSINLGSLLRPLAVPARRRGGSKSTISLERGRSCLNALFSAA